ncbi:hypothetical protein [Nocardia colli]|uniref:hypothetical protein n=1 Tax=Nocardia colli TaxID=2545717 RepID=UPI0035D7D172
MSMMAGLLAAPIIAGIAGGSVATAAPAHSMQAGGSALSQRVLVGVSPAQAAPKKITVTRQCDKVKNGTPANGHSEEKIRASGSAYNRKDAEKAADQEVDRIMPDGYHKRHCRTL